VQFVVSHKLLNCSCACVLLLQVSSQPLPAAAVVLAMHRLRWLYQEAARQARQQQQPPEQQQLMAQVLQQLTERLSEVRQSAELA
jgi:DNA-binding NarL/FixJ family response regulator